MKRKKLRQRLASGPLIVAPGIYDAYGARFVEQAGFEAVYLTGNGVSASLLRGPMRRKRTAWTRRSGAGGRSAKPAPT